MVLVFHGTLRNVTFSGLLTDFLLSIIGGKKAKCQSGAPQVFTRDFGSLRQFGIVHLSLKRQNSPTRGFSFFALLANFTPATTQRAIRIWQTRFSLNDSSKRFSHWFNPSIHPLTTEHTHPISDGWWRSSFIW